MPSFEDSWPIGTSRHPDHRIRHGRGDHCAAGLAPTGARILILERGARLRDSADARDARAIFQRGVFRPQETWLDGAGQPFNPGNYYYVGGNTKLYGAVLLRYRARDFEPVAYRDGATPGWPFAYDELEPWYSLAEKLYNVRGALGFDPTEPTHSAPYPFGPVPDEPAIAKVRERLKRVGLHPFPLPLGVDVDTWLKRAKTPWDAFPDTGTGKMDAETCGLAKALAHPNVELRENARVERLLVGSGRQARHGRGSFDCRGAQKRSAPRSSSLPPARSIRPRCFSASREGGIANRSDAVGRHFMNHNCSAVLAIDPRTVNDSVYQKTLGINDFYLDDGRGGPPLGNIQLLGRVTGANPQVQHSERAGMGARSHEPPLGRLVRDERGPAEPGKPRDGGRRTDPARLEAQQLERSRRARQGLQGAVARRGLSDRADETVRPAHAVASVRHRAHRVEPHDLAARPLLPRLGPSEPFRGRRLVPADLGGRQSLADDRRPGASRRRSYRQDRPRAA